MEIDICREYGQVGKIFFHLSLDMSQLIGAIWKSAANDCCMNLFWVHPLFHVGVLGAPSPLCFHWMWVGCAGSGWQGRRKTGHCSSSSTLCPPHLCSSAFTVFVFCIFFVFVFVTLQLLLNLVPTPSLSSSAFTVCICIYVFVFVTLQLLLNFICHNCANVHKLPNFER